MAEMNKTAIFLSTKQKQTRRQGDQTCDCQVEEMREQDGLGVWSWQMQTITFRMDKQQGPTVCHGELYSISWDKP